MNSNENKQKFFVVYQIINLINNNIYIGIHCTYNVSDKYMGSSKYLKKDIKELGKQNFEKIILHVFDNKEDMINKEAEIVNYGFCYRLDTYNRMIGGTNNGLTIDMVSVKDKDGKGYRVYRDDPRYISGELVANRKGNTVLSDKLKNDSEFEIKFKKQAGDNFRKAHKAGKIKYDVFKGKKHSVESKNKMSEKASLRKGKLNSQFGSCWITKAGENKKIKKEELQNWIIQGWAKGRICKKVV